MKLAPLRPHITFWALRGAWVLAVALWALALVPWFRTSPPASVAPPSTALRGAATAAPAGSRSQVEEIIEPAQPAAVAALPQRAASVVDPAPLPAREGAVCGLADGSGVADASSPAQRAGYVARQASLGLQLAFESLRARTDPLAQAAGWWLRVLMAREGAADPQPGSPPCAPGADCAAPAAAPLPAVATAVDALAQLAQAGSDAWVQQIAQRACDGATAASAMCASLGTRRWSAQEPDNAAAWLELAARDAQAVDEALYSAARSSRFDNHRGRLAAWVLQATSEQSPAMQRYAAWQRSDELERASDARVSAAAARSCNEAARRDANRDQLCDGVARWLPQTARAPAGAEPAAAAARSLDCTTIERQWREARDAAQRGNRVAAQATAR